MMQKNNEIQIFKVKKNYTNRKLTFQKKTLLDLFNAYKLGHKNSMSELAVELEINPFSIDRCYKAAFKENFDKIDFHLRILASLHEHREEIKKSIGDQFPGPMREIDKERAAKSIEDLYKRFIENNSSITLTKNHINLVKKSREMGLGDIVQLLEKKSAGTCLTEGEYNNVCTFLLASKNAQINLLMTNISYLQIFAQIKEESPLSAHQTITLNILIEDLKKIVDTKEHHNQIENILNIEPRKRYIKSFKPFQEKTLLQLFKAYGRGGLNKTQISRKLELKHNAFFSCFQNAFPEAHKMDFNFKALALLDDTFKDEIEKLIHNKYPSAIENIDDRDKAAEFIEDLYKKFVKKDPSIIFEKNDMSQINVASNKRKRETELADIIELLEKKSGGIYLTDEEYNNICVFFLDSNENQIKLLINNNSYSAILGIIRDKSPLLEDNLIMLNNLIQELKNIINTKTEIPPRKKVKNNQEHNSLNKGNEIYEDFQNFEASLNKEDEFEYVFNVNQGDDIFQIEEIKEVNNNQIINSLLQNPSNIPNMYVNPMNSTNYNHDNIIQNPNNSNIYINSMNQNPVPNSNNWNQGYQNPVNTIPFNTHNINNQNMYVNPMNPTNFNHGNLIQNPNNPNIYINSMQYPTFNSNNWNQGYQNPVNTIPFNNTLSFNVEPQSNIVPLYQNEANLGYTSQFNKRLYVDRNKNAFFNRNNRYSSQLGHPNSIGMVTYPFQNRSN